MGSGVRERTWFRFARWSPFLLIAAAAIADWVTPGPQRYDRLLSAAPALAAATWSVRGTVGIGLFSGLTQYVLAFDRTADSYQAPSGTSTGVIGAVTLAAAYASLVRQRHERDLSEVRAVADTAQRMVLRPLPHRLDGVELDVLYLAAAAQARIGGDFYEALRTPYGVRAILGDVQGKGLAAVEAASVLLGAFREWAYEAPDLGVLAARLERSMTRYGDQPPASDAAERFATAVLVEIPPGQGIARLVNLGHPAPLLLAAGTVWAVEPAVPQLPVNLSLLADDDDPAHVETIAFAPGDRLLLFTDGVSETRDAAGEFYPLADRVRQWQGEPSPALLDTLRADLRAFGASPRDDDVAALVVGRVSPDTVD
ncbi:PP2C family protein-serine/threonine phosphatase [Yinghuangia soli]|uniref:Serine/threonine-protein phosphatase n=1 Tax=Yinghuangia soli TaxID=2908204 RepID=A0AA41TYQ1_9ACTN|nr:PP2C family protein-serine/threonine phosphatase [Yinghuangia soli]MCF2528013.1 serine/threonine-protein phosphatase [Yinghuangia soli]